MSDTVSRFVCLACARNQPAGTGAYFAEYRHVSVHVSRIAESGRQWRRHCREREAVAQRARGGRQWRSGPVEAGGSGAAVQASQGKSADHLSSSKTSYGTSLVPYGTYSGGI